MNLRELLDEESTNLKKEHLKALDMFYREGRHKGKDEKGLSKKELAIGTKIEMEHTSHKKIAREIAKDHVKEFPQYYSKILVPGEKAEKKRILKTPTHK
jgi:hypothetical protein